MSTHDILPGELKNERPSEQELRRYFVESCRLLSEVELPARYDTPYIREAFFKFGCREYLNKIGDVIWEALNRLNELDRQDTFWLNTNRRPTVMKIFEFAKRKLKEAPNDRDQLWVMAVMDSFCGANNFGEEWWIRLWQLGVLDISWPLRAGLWNEMNLGFGPELMIDFLAVLGSPGEARPLLKQMAAADNSEIRTWARNVMRGTYSTQT